MSALKINGLKLDRFPLELTPVADLIFDEYLFLRLLRTKKGESFLQYWFDKCDEIERWIYVEISHTHLEGYLDGVISLYQLLQSKQTPFLYFTEEDSDGYIRNTYATTWHEFPRESLPTDDSFYEYEVISLQEGDRKQYSVNMRGDWRSDELAHFFSYFKQSYSLVAFLSNPTEFEYSPEEKVISHGFQVFSHLERLVSVAKERKFEMSMLGMTFASPGTINYELHNTSCTKLLRVIACVVENTKGAKSIYKRVEKMFDELDIRGERALTIKVPLDTDVLLKAHAMQLIEAMGFDENVEFISQTASGLVAAQRTCSYYRLINNRLGNFMRDGKIEFSPAF